MVGKEGWSTKVIGMLLPWTLLDTPNPTETLSTAFAKGLTQNRPPIPLDHVQAFVPVVGPSVHISTRKYVHSLVLGT